MTEQPKDASCGWTPLMEHCGAAVVEALDVVEGAAGVVDEAFGVVDGVVIFFGVVEGAFDVVDRAVVFLGVVEGAFEVVDGVVDGLVVESPLFFFLV
jgi:hypothetical protein